MSSKAVSSKAVSFKTSKAASAKTASPAASKAASPAASEDAFATALITALTASLEAAFPASTEDAFAAALEAASPASSIASKSASSKALASKISTPKAKGHHAISPGGKASGTRAGSTGTGRPPTGRSAADRAKLVLAAFDGLYPDADCALTQRDPFGLLVSTILSAQCTDQRVNMVAPRLLAAYPGPVEMGAAPPGAVEDIIRSCGFFRMKAKNIREASMAISERFGGQVPRSLDELVTLPGVGRKTANCVLANAFGLPGITVDTHLGRISRRLGLTVHEDPVKVEADLAAVIPESRWSLFSHQGIAHGRALCRSQRPLCAECPLDFCDWPGRAGRPA
ncbi:MAG: endonuclease III [Deltaproteobacteria bacterium]|nr:endonuclease III [Deltaproteobacteria bacterium]